ncbi:hypothetical protein [Jeongeupia naejangsanensis]|uniref:ABC-type transport auxiliary lipoprotein component domain-containing protein n=1 Tax=Jeongeupia naejangsanensis TaxID=613195 RepID=A0ABS2BKP4_9NEIS|nr:hypothetical protein [Jeongeupia naejangsanensis]MBM3116189.1 hypothetical protein [Jeongeupia naejangsanensis]
MRTLLILVATVLLAACAASRPTAEFNYVLNAERPAQSAPTLAGATVYVGALAIDEPFGQRGFIYRETAHRFVTDPYRGYVAPPARQIENRLKEWLIAAGATLTQDPNAASHAIDGRISALYTELQPEQPREAVVRLQLALRNGKTPARQLAVAGHAPISPMNGDGIAAAANTALAEALSQLETALAGESRATLR